jgi:hypothetical protein
MFNVDKIRTKLVCSRLELADIDSGSTNIRSHLVSIDLKLLHTLLQPIDISTQEHSLGTGLADTRLELEDACLDLVNIGAQSHHIQVDTVRDDALVLEFTANVLILAVAAVDVALLGEYVRAQLEHTGVQLVHAVMEMGER